MTLGRLVRTFFRINRHTKTTPSEPENTLYAQRYRSHLTNIDKSPRNTQNKIKHLDHLCLHLVNPRNFSIMGANKFSFVFKQVQTKILLLIKRYQIRETEEDFSLTCIYPLTSNCTFWAFHSKNRRAFPPRDFSNLTYTSIPNYPIIPT